MKLVYSQGRFSAQGHVEKIANKVLHVTWKHHMTVRLSLMYTFSKGLFHQQAGVVTFNLEGHMLM